MSLKALVHDLWNNWGYKKGGIWGVLYLILYPFSIIYYILLRIRYYLYSTGFIRRVKVSVPVVSVGNLTLGGTGKTPFVIALSKFLKGKGFKVGVVSRGYGRNLKGIYVLKEEEIGDPYKFSRDFGEEAVMVCVKAGVNVAVADKKWQGALMLDKLGCDVIIVDDGFQHIKLCREIDILLIDGVRGFGNCFLFPAGPLREPLHRITDADIVVVTKKRDLGFLRHVSHLVSERNLFYFVPSYYFKRKGEITKPPKETYIITQVANPSGLIEILNKEGVRILGIRIFKDHHGYVEDDLAYLYGKPVTVTEKDVYNMPQDVLLKLNPFVVCYEETLPEDLSSYIEEKICLLTGREYL